VLESARRYNTTPVPSEASAPSSTHVGGHVKEYVVKYRELEEILRFRGCAWSLNIRVVDHQFIIK